MIQDYGLSIVVPVLNEEKTIEELVKQIDGSLTSYNIGFEIIFVDDGSKDGTLTHIETLQHNYPISLYTRKKKLGRASALKEGIMHAKYPLIACLDADLAYSPSVLPEMLRALYVQKVDIVIARRVPIDIPLVRRFESRAYRIIAGKWLHNIDTDIRSGLKVFKKDIVDRIILKEDTYGLDLEFLLKARNAGYTVGSVFVDFHKRVSKRSKRKQIHMTCSLLATALKLKMSSPQVIPFSKDMEEEQGKGFHFKGNKYINHTSLDLRRTAFKGVTRIQFLLMTACIALISLGFVANWHRTIVIFIAILTLVYFLDLSFNFFLIIRSFRKAPEIVVGREQYENRMDWPSYTVFCPLYKEAEVLPQFVQAMKELDYPKDKLQVMLLLEEDDVQTITLAQSFGLPEYFEIIVIPHSLPKTKPKACNYGLIHARGEYAVIYDAEDMPDFDQLKKAVIAFEKSPSYVKCIQAKLNFYNARQNILTRAFTAEYSLWFDLVLTGLQSVNAPIPLGGTSNHFRIADLHKLKGWDAFNVTEDCDLGIRLLKEGYRTAILDSTTYEEANSNLKNWYNQRTRWIKGYIQTYFVHMRDPHRFFHKWNDIHLFTFQLVVGGKVLSMFINPFMWFITILYFVARAHVGTFIESFYPTPVLYMGLFSLIFGNFLYMYYYMIGCAKRGYDDLIKFVFLIPLYWLAMSVAAWRAVYQMLTNPHYWYKTKHGLHLKKQIIPIPTSELVEPHMNAEMS